MDSIEHNVKESIEQLESTLNEAKQDFDVDSVLFKSSKIYRMGRFMRLYADLMNHLDVLGDNETASAIQDLESNNELKLGERLAHVKRDWDGFLEKVENEVKK
jgi:hypothetical protein